MNVTILGGTGFIGRHLQARFQQQDYTVKAYGRKAFATETSLINAINGCDLLVILVGENIGNRWSAAYKKALFQSRIETNRKIQSALQQCSSAPKKILSASAIGIYPQNDCDHPLDEGCEAVGDGFLGQLGHAWETASLQLKPTPVIMRFGVVLGADGGALQKMLPAFKWGLGGPVAGGEQCFSWIHIDDLTRAILFLANHQLAEGVYNLCSPDFLSNKAFGKALADVLQRPFWLPLPEWQLKLMFGEGAQVLTHSSAILPTRLCEIGFEFDYAQIYPALTDLLN